MIERLKFEVLNTTVGSTLLVLEGAYRSDSPEWSFFVIHTPRVVTTNEVVRDQSPQTVVMWGHKLN